MIVGVMADTHGYLDPAVLEHFADCQEIWHAGDFGPHVVEPLRAFKQLRGVYGNIDASDIRGQFTENELFVCEGVSLLMTHIAGRLGKYNQRVRELIAAHRPQILVCGHSHIPRIEKDKKYELIHLNPGAAGHQGFHSQRTIVRLELAAGKIAGVKLIELGPRRRRT